MAKPIRNSVALYVGTPPDIRSQIEKQWFEKGLLKTKPTFTQELLPVERAR
ncbi:hypothetical protein [Calothrix sp. CCY 0018]|uniref:hypothetical protein n=1 Tax=Calothrix sp. CCY 0018 TaxID=3103864 RepID=UPI0039C71815